MLKLFSKSKPLSEISKTGFSLLKTDMHSHLIPGIDDGSPDMETSVSLVKGMVELGYTKLITTPHILWDVYKNTREVILEKLELLREAVKAEGVTVEIQAAAEYFLDAHVEGLLKSNQPLLTLGGNKVLVEFSMAFPSHGLKEIFFEMQMQGYEPVVAHPERYIYLNQNKKFYDELKDIGCLFQLNLLSLNGYYGKAPMELAQYLIRQEYYDFAGTDLHSFHHLEALRHPALAAQLNKLLATGKIKNGQL